MKASKWRDLSDDELKQKARELGEESSIYGSSSRWEWPRTPRVSPGRRDLARAYTVLRERKG